MLVPDSCQLPQLACRQSEVNNLRTAAMQQTLQRSASARQADGITLGEIEDWRDI